jgi:hypothetical protein
LTLKGGGRAAETDLADAEDLKQLEQLEKKLKSKKDGEGNS